MQIDLEDMIRDVEEEENYLFKLGARYAVLGQSFIEILDEVKNTPMYSRKIKNLINSLTREMEKNIHISEVFNEGQYIVTDLSKGIENYMEEKLNKKINEIKSE